MKRQARRTIRKPRPLSATCYYCDTKTVPDYKDVSVLGKFTTERGMLLSSERTGICRKHQRMLTREVKRARFVALLPFVVRA